ncbi:His Kinase A (phospho-acceptor) domain-containing protein [Sphingomonas sp. NFR04]|uniref:sensor histidine kinase n=1 Tax=Sphingomonas sp. NFR04 TaxID=1566283 RepID=UPI0008E29B44|nr:ATP-binding protein [Sphingomonas sp. NFR04]SFK40350.1 His Kinase A (phospho-acceptor) domain-containing protein [Sphingomonas sp. NFR04]
MVQGFEHATRAVDAMGLALGRFDVGAGAAALLDGLAARELPQARRDDLLRRLLGEVRLVALNCRAGKLLGIGEDALPLAASALWPFARADQLVESLQTRGEPDACFRTQLELKVPGGTLPVHYTSWCEEADPAGQITFGLLDRSDQVAAEEALIRQRTQMAHADRLSTLGVMTATIAHEVRQPLSVILASAQAALRWLRRAEPDLAQVEQCLDMIVLGGAKAEETVARLRGLAASRSEARGRCALRPLIEETADFLRPELASRQATLVLDIAGGLPPVQADGVQLRQVLINLLINAAQAMADAQCWNRALKLRARADGGFVQIDVEDTGPGVPVADRDRLFEGFYTTKASGLGLGLKICRQIVEDHGGTIDHVPRSSGGSIFRIRLPVEG